MSLVLRTPDPDAGPARPYVPLRDVPAMRRVLERLRAHTWQPGEFAALTVMDIEALRATKAENELRERRQP